MLPVEKVDLLRIRDQQGWGRKKPATEDIDLALVELIAQVVLEVRRKQGA